MILLLAFGLALDAFAVSVTCGILAIHPRLSHALRIGALFGVFQAIMPLLGWQAGSLLGEFVTDIDHWVAFALLSLVGVHMIYESVTSVHGHGQFDPTNIHVLLVLSVATSIDALAAGISFAFFDVAILHTVLVIGIVTFCLSFTGYYLGDRIGHFFEKRIRILGGIILISIGVKILVEHLR